MCVFAYWYIHICVSVYVCVCVFLDVCMCMWFHICAFFKGHHSSIKFDISRNTLTTSSVMFFQRSFGVLGLSTLYTSTKVTQLVLINHQLVDRNLTAAKKKKKITKNSMRLYEKYLQWNIQSNMSLSNPSCMKKKG